MEQVLEISKAELTVQEVKNTKELFEVEKVDEELVIEELNKIAEVLKNLSLQTPIARETTRKILREVENEINWNGCILGEINDSILFEERKE